MRLRIFTFLVAFLAIAGNAVWGQEATEINISFMNNDPAASSDDYGKYTITSSNPNGIDDNDQSNILTIEEGGSYRLVGGESNIQIKVTAKEPVYITLAPSPSANRFHVDASLNNRCEDPDDDDAKNASMWENRCAMEIADGATVILDWEGDCELSSGGLRAGINVKPDATLILRGTSNGLLQATCWNNQNGVYTVGAGIGGDSVEPDFGTIIIESGNIEARCYAQVTNWRAYGAGIGGGYTPGNPTIDSGKGSTKGMIIIKGGNVTATANYPGGSGVQPTTGISAAIGGGYKGTCTNIAILGGTVNATTGDDADEIGVGKDYKGGVTNGIIIGNWDENTNTNVNEDAKINNVNYVNGLGKKPTVTGTVTMPDNTQMYTMYYINGNNSGKFHSYNIKLKADELLGESHNINSSTYGNRYRYYYGANMSFTEDRLTCTQNHLFLGWYDKTNKKAVPVIKDKAEFKMPAVPPTSNISYTYDAVWVESERSFLVKSGTKWTTESTDGNTPAPEIAYTPNGVLENLKFTDPGETELGTLTFAGNKLLGEPTLPSDKSFVMLELEIPVKLVDTETEGDPKNVKVTIRCVENVIIDAVSVEGTTHIYNGEYHNGINEDGKINDDNVLNVEMRYFNTEEDVDATSLKEGVFYRIYQYTFDGQDVIAKPEDKTLPIIDAGTYSNITIEALNATFGQSMESASGKLSEDRLRYTLPENATIVVQQRPMDITFSVVGEVVEDEEPTINIDYEDFVSNRGLVETENPNVTYELDYECNDDQTQMDVYIKNIVVSDDTDSKFKTSNYKMKYVINGMTYTIPRDNGGSGDEPGEGEKEFPEEGVIIGTVDIIPASTGGGTKKKYQLYLANKDYLETGETPIYYEKEGLELFSRHNKKYTYAGGSFTIWYEKDGVPNDGNYRIFWSKSANGEYKEVKFDTVSEYYQIRNVYSNVFVKIFYENGFPVANEEISATDARAYAQANKIVVITPEPTDVQIISMAGAVVATDKVTGQREFTNLTEGVYIVRMGETTVKLQVRD